jgi:hypothetical protein
MSSANSTASRTAGADSGTTPTTRTEKGISLARGPALILGTILTVAGLFFLYKAHTFAKFSKFPNGTAHIDGKFFFGIFGVNGWSAMLTAVAGALLLFGAAQHLLAKTMSLIVGACLAAAALIALFSSGNILGLGAANHLTELGWGVCAVILLFNTLAPRRRRTVVVADEPAAADAGARRPLGVAREPVAAEPVTRTQATVVPVREPADTDDASAAPVTRTVTRVEPVTRTDAGAEPVTRTDMAAEPVAGTDTDTVPDREPVAATTTPADGAPDEAVVRHAALHDEPAS